MRSKWIQLKVVVMSAGTVATLAAVAGAAVKWVK
jgi:hypothetical protein